MDGRMGGCETKGAEEEETADPEQTLWVLRLKPNELVVGLQRGLVVGIRESCVGGMLGCLDCGPELLLGRGRPPEKRKQDEAVQEKPP